LRRATDEGVKGGEIEAKEASEVSLVLTLDNFDKVLESAETKRAPHILCEHVYTLAQAFSRFYTDCPVFKEGTPSKVQASRLSLAKTTLRQLETCLDILGIETPERM